MIILTTKEDKTIFLQAESEGVCGKWLEALKKATNVLENVTL